MKKQILLGAIPIIVFACLVVILANFNRLTKNLPGFVKPPAGESPNAMVLPSPQKVTNPQVRSELSMLMSELDRAKLFGFSGLGNVFDDAVVGKVTIWKSAEKSLTISDSGITFKNTTAKKGKNPNPQSAEKASRQFAKDKKLDESKLVLSPSYTFAELAGDEFLDTENSQNADLVILEFMQNEKRKALFYVTGAGDIWKMNYLF